MVYVVWVLSLFSALFIGYTTGWSDAKKVLKK